MLAGGGDLPGVLPDLLRMLRVPAQQHGEAHNGVHGGADVVGHVGQEVALGLVGGLGGVEGLPQGLIHLPLLGAVGEHEDELVLVLQGAVVEQLLEPAQLLGPGVENVPLPGPHPAHGHGGEDLGGELGGGAGEPLLLPVEEDGARVGPDRLRVHAQNPVQIGADVLGVKAILGGEEDKDVLRVLREQVKELLPGADLPVLLPHPPPAGVDAGGHRAQGQDPEEQGHDGQGDQGEAAHAGVDHVRRGGADQHPAGEANGLIGQVVGPAIQPAHGGQALPALPVPGHVLRLHAGEGASAAQIVQEVGGRVGAAVGGKEDLAAGEDHKAAALVREGFHPQAAGHVLGGEGEADGGVGKAPVGPRLRGHGEQGEAPAVGGLDLRGGIREVQPGQGHPARLPLTGDIGAVGGEEIEGGEVPRLPLLQQEVRQRRRVRLRGDIGLPGAQEPPIFGDSGAQGGVDLTVDLLQPADALLVDLPGGKPGIEQAQHNDSGQRRSHPAFSTHNTTPPHVRSTGRETPLCSQYSIFWRTWQEDPPNGQGN